MTLYLFKYCLPVLLGYTLFVGLSGRLNPLVKPDYPEERPLWFLGLWTGISVAIVSVVGLHMAYSMTLEGVESLLPPTALFMAVLLIPGFVAYFHYRRIVVNELQASRTPRTSRDMLKAAASVTPNRLDGLSPEFASFAEDSAEQAPESIHNAQDTMRTKDTNAPVVATFLDLADLQTLDTHQKEAANNDSALYESGYMSASDPAQEDYMDDTIFEELHYSALDLDETTLTELSLTGPHSNIESAHGGHADADRLLDMKWMDESTHDQSVDSEAQLMSLPEAQYIDEDAYEDELLFAPGLLDTDEEMNYLFEPETLAVGDKTNTWFELDNLRADEQSDELTAEQSDANSTGQVDVITDNASFLSELELLESDLRLDDAGPRIKEVCEQSLIDSTEKLAITHAPTTLDADLSEERSAHQETARQLYATRKALATLTSGAEGSEADQTASFLQMRDDLSQSHSEHVALEGLVQQEASKRLELESTVAELQQNLIMSKQDVRRSTAARAKALGTANKAIAFARQTLQVRALLEEELEQARETLTRRQSTISSLIGELENEKERTQAEVSFMVQQLVLHEQQLKARRNLEVATDNFDSTLPARAPKRIESQSLSSDM